TMMAGMRVAFLTLAAAVSLTTPAVCAAGAAAQNRPAAEAPIPHRLMRIQRELFSGTANPREVIRDLQAILAIDEQSREAHLLLGLAYRALGTQEFIAEAVAELRQTLAIDPNQPPARLYLAYCYRDLGRLDRAREELQTALEQAP